MNWFKRNEKTFGITFGIVGLLFGLYAYLFPIERQGKVFFQLVDTISVFVVNRPIEELKVFVNSRDIREDSLSLKFYKIRLLNSGAKDILPDYFDNTLPFGIQVKKGNILSAKVTGWSNNYLKDRILLRYDSSMVILNPIIIQKKEKVDLELLITYNVHENPEILPSGKIAGFNELKFISQIRKDNKWGEFWKKILKILFGFGMIVLIVWVITVIISVFERVRLHRIIKKYKIQHSEISDFALKLFKIYSKIGKKDFINASEILLNDEALNKEFKLKKDLDSLTEKLESWKKDNKVRYEELNININSYVPYFLRHIKDLGVYDSRVDFISLNENSKKELKTIMRILS